MSTNTETIIAADRENALIARMWCDVGCIHRAIEDALHRFCEFGRHHEFRQLFDGKKKDIAPYDKVSRDILRQVHPLTVEIFSNCIHSMLAILRSMFTLRIEFDNLDRVVGGERILHETHCAKFAASSLFCGCLRE